MADVGEARFKAVSDFGALFRDLDTLKGKIATIESTGTGMSRGISKSMTAVGTSMSQVGSTMTRKVTLPIVGAVGLAVHTFTGFEEAIESTGLVAGATEAQFADLREEALRLGVETRFSPEEAAKGMYELSSAGLEVNEILGATPAVLNFATASGLDLGSAAGVVAETMNAFGLGAEEATRIGDVMTAMLQTSTFHADELGPALANAGQLGATANQSFESVAAGLATIRSQGIPAAQAGTAMRRAMDNLKAPAEKAGNVMNALGIEVRDSAGNMKQFPQIVQSFQGALNAANPAFVEMMETTGLGEQALRDYIGTTIFGTEGQKAMALSLNSTTEAFNDGAEGTALIAAVMGEDFVAAMGAGESVTLDAGDAVDALSNKYQNAGGTTDKFAKKMRDTLGGQLIELKGSLETLAITFVDTFAEPMKLFVQDTMIPFVNGIRAWIAENPGLATLGLKIAGIAAAAGPLLLVGGNLLKMFGGLGGESKLLTTLLGQSTSMLGFLRGAIGSVAKVLLTNPFGLLLTAFGILIASSPELREVLGRVVTTLVKSLAPILETIGDLFVDLLEAFMPIIDVLVDLLIPVFEAFAWVIEEVVAPVLEWIADFIAGTVGPVFSALGDAVSWVTDLFTPNKDKAKAVGDVMKDDLAKGAAQADAAIRGVGYAITDETNPALDAIDGKTQDLDETLLETGGTIRGYVIPALGEAGDAADDLGGRWEDSAVHTQNMDDKLLAMAKRTTEELNPALESTEGPITGMAEDFDQTADEIEESFGTRVQETIGETVGLFAQKAGEVETTADEMLTNIQEAIQQQKDFADNIAILTALGLDNIVTALVAKGPEAAGEAQALADDITTAFEIEEQLRSSTTAGVAGIIDVADYYGPAVDSIFRLLGADAALGFAAGIRTYSPQASQAAIDMTAAAQRAAAAGLEIRSPSQTMADEIGRPMVEGVAKGIRDGIPVLLKAMERMNFEFKSFRPDFPTDAFSNLTDSLRPTIPFRSQLSQLPSVGPVADSVRERAGNTYIVNNPDKEETEESLREIVWKQSLLGVV